MKVNLKTANEGINSFRFTIGHGTTNKFFEPSVPFIKELRKGTTMKIKMSSLRRIDPMPLPPMSMVDFNTRFYFVPMIDICPYYHNLDEGTMYYAQGNKDEFAYIPTSTPILDNKTLLTMFFSGLTVYLNSLDHPVYPIVMGKYLNNIDTNQTYLKPVTDVHMSNGEVVVDDGVKYDVSIKVTYVEDGVENTNIGYFKFTRRGRTAYKVLHQLGYDFAIGSNDEIKRVVTTGNPGSDQTTKYLSENNVKYSALKLLAYLKVYLDYYETSKFINSTTRLNQLKQLLHIDVDAYTLHENEVDLIVDTFLYMSYKNDYFTTQFISPSNGNNYVENNQSISIDDITDPSLTSIETLNNGTAAVDTSGGYITKNALNLLERLNRFLKRHQIIGGRTLDRMLAEYGIASKNISDRRTSFIENVHSEMSISPVLNTTSEQLGDYAGYGQSNQRDNIIEIDTNGEDGYVIAIDTISPEIFYRVGYDRENRHITKFDFVAGTDFDAIGVQATEVGELLMNKEGKYSYINNTSPHNLTMGYKPRGAEYKEMVNKVTGDFEIESVNTDIEAYFTSRFILAVNHLNTNNEIQFAFSRSFVSTYGKDNYAKIFYYNGRKTDYIKSIFRFEIEMKAPYKKLYDEYELNDEKGKEIRLEVGGSTMD